MEPDEILWLINVMDSLISVRKQSIKMISESCGDFPTAEQLLGVIECENYIRECQNTKNQYIERLWNTK